MDLHDDELTAEERARFSALPRERPPSAYLEERIVQALRRDGVVRAPWYRRTVTVPVAAAAGLLLFALGAAAGNAAPWLSPRAEPAAPPARERVIESPPDGRLVTWM
jgi:hypothetical protein